jgi:transglutaminase-like putative cysteine protease
MAVSQPAMPDFPQKQKPFNFETDSEAQGRLYLIDPMFLRIDHTTLYRYAVPVGFVPHLLRLLPRTVPGLHLLQSKLTINPTAAVKWNLDLLGNIVGVATFPGSSDELLIKSSLLLEQYHTNPFDFLLEGRALSLPLAYEDRERSLLAPFLQISDPGAASLLGDWLKPFLDRNRDLNNQPFTLGTLTGLNAAIPTMFRYAARHTDGVLSVRELLDSGEGTCRDFANLMIQAARFLGIAARYISGYLCSSPGGVGGQSFTHAWCEFYLPGAGWRSFDPTNGILADAHHIAIAISVNAGEIPPVEGNYCGAPNLCIAHDVAISARELLPGEESIN